MSPRLTSFAAVLLISSAASYAVRPPPPAPAPAATDTPPADARPAVTDETRIFIRDGRHPVLDQNVTEEKFVPNDCLLDGTENRLLLITGPKKKN